MPLFLCLFTLPLQAYGNLSTKYLENRLNQDHDIWLTDCVQGVDDLIILWQNSECLTELSPFSDFGISYSKAILSTKYLENHIS